SDGTIRIWDVRSKSRKPALTMQISETDVNVLSWSRQTTHLLATGADDGVWAVWDLRQWKPSSGSAPEKQRPIASFNYHKEQMTIIVKVTMRRVTKRKLRLNRCGNTHTDSKQIEESRYNASN